MTGRWLAAILLVGAACAPAAPARPVPSADELIVSAENGTFVLDPETGATRRSLPAGALSPAKDLILAVSPAATVCGDPRSPQPCTLATAYDLKGALIEEWFLEGRYDIPSTYGPAPSVFSPNGKWAVLVKRDAATSTFAILDLTGARQRSTAAGGHLAAPVAKGRWERVELGARFSFDAIHDDGAALYLIEHPVAGSTAYNVRLYDVRGKRLQPEPIFDKAQLSAFDPGAGLMDGAFHASVAPAGGEWSYGLYVRRDGKPFVHALNVAGRYATCIVDLPGTRGGSSMLALALAPDAARLFVTDTGTGAVSEIDTATQKVARRGSFAGRGGSGDGTRAAAAVSADGSRLYATASTGIAVVATADLTLRSWAGPDLSVRAIALASSGTRLYGLAGESVHVFEAPSGRPLAALGVPTGARAIAVIAAR